MEFSELTDPEMFEAVMEIGIRQLLSDFILLLLYK